MWNLIRKSKNDLDIISFGPELTGVHTYNERVHGATAVSGMEQIRKNQDSFITFSSSTASSCASKISSIFLSALSFPRNLSNLLSSIIPAILTA